MFCSRCGKEVADNAQFCQFCGNKLIKEEEKEKTKEVDLSIHKPKQENSSLGCMPIISLILLVIFLFITIKLGGADSDTSTNSTSASNTSCPPVAEMVDAINKYKSVNIIQKFTPELNSVYIPTYARNNMNIDDLKVLGYITACYSAHVKKNDLVWVDIYNYNTGKRIAKYSDSWGFKMVE